MPEAKTTRNRLLCDCWLYNDVTYTHVSKTFGLSLERTRQIIGKEIRLRIHTQRALWYNLEKLETYVDWLRNSGHPK